MELSMRRNERLPFYVVRTFIALLLLAVVPALASSQKTPDFSGQWKQANDRCQPKRKGNVTLRIEQLDPKFTVETTINRDPASPRHASQSYTTDGKISVSTGVDGDEFHTSIVWKEAALVFTIEEHEDGRILRSQETWTLIENGAALQRVRESKDTGEKQTLIYLRQQPSATGAIDPPGSPLRGGTRFRQAG
jgi:hypothetical protein